MPADPVLFPALLAVVGFVAGAVAPVSGFGIGSLLTPVQAVRVGAKLAVAAVSVPHLTATGSCRTSSAPRRGQHVESEPPSAADLADIGNRIRSPYQSNRSPDTTGRTP